VAIAAEKVIELSYGVEELTFYIFGVFGRGVFGVNHFYSPFNFV
jgi:hypothetical protein